MQNPNYELCILDHYAYPKEITHNYPISKSMK
jgi:hypothetical protein